MSIIASAYHDGKKVAAIFERLDERLSLEKKVELEDWLWMHGSVFLALLNISRGTEKYPSMQFLLGGFKESEAEISHLDGNAFDAELIRIMKITRGLVMESMFPKPQKRAKKIKFTGEKSNTEGEMSPSESAVFVRNLPAQN
jgi:hypothetical protein